MGQTARANPDRAEARTRTSRVPDLLLAVLLFVGALGVRWLWAADIGFPLSEESAFYLVSAEQVTSGRGLEVDVLWTYQYGFESVAHPSHEFWMPLVTALMAAAFAVQQAVSGALSSTWQLAQMPGVVLGALLAPLTYLLGRRALPGSEAMDTDSWTGSRWASLAAALLVLASPALGYQSAVADSSSIFGLWAAWALMTAARRPGDQGGYLSTGLLVALAFLTHTEGLWLLLSIPLAWWLLPDPKLARRPQPDEPGVELVRKPWPREKESAEEWRRARGPGLRHVLDLVVAFAILVTPWLVRNYLTLGTPWPRMMLGQVWLTDPVDAFGFLAQPSPQAWLAQGWSELAGRCGQALLQNAGLLLSSTFPWGVLALPGLWLLRREWSFVPFLIYGSLVSIGAALILPVSTMSGSLNRSLGGLLPFLTLAAMYTLLRVVQEIRRFRRLAIAVSVVLVLLLLLQAATVARRALPIISEGSQTEQDRFESAADWLNQNASTTGAVMTNRGYAFNYVSRQPTIALPGNETTEAAWTAAQRHSARFLLIVGSFGRYPQILEASPDARFQRATEGDGFQIYRITGAQP